MQRGATRPKILVFLISDSLRGNAWTAGEVIIKSQYMGRIPLFSLEEGGKLPSQQQSWNEQDSFVVILSSPLHVKQ